jgi:hypothetical protein
MPSCSAARFNDLRRRALESLGRMRVDARRGPAPEVLPLPAAAALPGWTGRPLLAVACADREILERARAWGADEILFEPADVTPEGLSRAPESPFTLLLPPTLTGDDLDGLYRWACDRPNIAGAILSNPGHLALSWPFPVRLDAPMNLMNSRAAAFFGLPYAPSVELTARQAAGNGRREGAHRLRPPAADAPSPLPAPERGWAGGTKPAACATSGRRRALRPTR